MGLPMRTVGYTRRGLTSAATATVLSTAVLITAVLTSVTLSATADTAATVASGGFPQAGSAKAAGWRVVKAIGPATGYLSGLLTEDSSNDSWSIWTGPGLTLVDRWTGNAWARVPLPSELGAYVQATVSLSASSPANAWLFGTHGTTGALRWTGAGWVLQKIPSWILRRGSSGTISARSAVFGPGNVWVFSLGAGPYAAHYSGRSWAKVKLPAVPTDESAVAPDDIWALGTASVLHWNGTKWTTTGLPGPPLPTGATVSYSNLTAAGPDDAWLLRTISFPSRIPVTVVMHWNGKSWRTVASPADIVGSIAPDGHGGLWATGIDVNPGGFWLLYHLVAGHWTTEYPPAGVDNHAPEILTWIRGTRSLWAAGSAFTPKGYYGVILKHGV